MDLSLSAQLQRYAETCNVFFSDFVEQAERLEQQVSSLTADLDIQKQMYRDLVAENRALQAKTSYSADQAIRDRIACEHSKRRADDQKYAHHCWCKQHPET
jgi:regulator of replication initiation timing